jgi:DNA end-binding protein Ku
MLLMNTLRFANEIRAVSELNLPGAGRNGLGEKEIAMGKRLVEDMTEEWKPEQFKDTYTDDLMRRIEAKIASGETHTITAPSEDGGEPRRGAEVIDLVSLLRKSLDKKGKGGDAGDEAANDEKKEQPKRAAARKSPSRISKKTPQRKRA